MTNKPDKPAPPLSRTLLLGAILIAVIAITMMALLSVQQNPTGIEPAVTQMLTPDG